MKSSNIKQSMNQATFDAAAGGCCRCSKGRLLLQVAVAGAVKDDCCHSLATAPSSSNVQDPLGTWPPALCRRLCIRSRPPGDSRRLVIAFVHLNFFSTRECASHTHAPVGGVARAYIYPCGHHHRTKNILSLSAALVCCAAAWTLVHVNTDWLVVRTRDQNCVWNR